MDGSWTSDAEEGGMKLALCPEPDSTPEAKSEAPKRFQRVARNYTGDQRRLLLAQAAQNVMTHGVSLRLAADKYGLAKSSLSDYLKKKGIDVRSRSYLRTKQLKRLADTDDSEDKVFSQPSAKICHLPTQVPLNSFTFSPTATVSSKSKSKSWTDYDKSSSVDLLGVPQLRNSFLLQENSLSMASTSTMNRAQGLCDFVNKSPSPFHVVRESRSLLKQGGFQELKEQDSWSVEPNGRYFITRNGSSLLALAVGGRWEPGNGFSIIGAHTDSPCLKLKPVSARSKTCGYVQLGVQTYGGGLWYTWFDRDLTVAGRVVVRNGASLNERLVHINRPVLRVPSLAIHLNRGANEGFTVNKETDLAPILCTVLKDQVTGSDNDSDKDLKAKEKKSSHPPELLQLLADELGVTVESIVDLELCVVDTQPAQLGGLKSEFVFAPRLDNQVSCFTGLHALLESPGLEEDTHCRVLCLYDHEEVGSESAQGAASLLTELILRRVCGTSHSCAFEQSMARSVLLSADQAHAVHPNYEDKHEKNHKIDIHGGVVLKHNTNQRYATNARTASLLKECAHRSGDLPLQDFVVRQDVACGSTIGPILSARLGIATLDVGSPQLAMHSCREMGSAPGVEQCVLVFQAFYQHLPSVLSTYTEPTDD